MTYVNECQSQSVSSVSLKINIIVFFLWLIRICFLSKATTRTIKYYEIFIDLLVTFINI